MSISANLRLVIGADHAEFEYKQAQNADPEA
ncbi:hypothetical protein QFZ36_001604 [Pseudarthrobacter siccitolerans]|uniref:Uncharacterized protein n=1 Tax=Pseudarthrobacter siccitolerans TaxID=861266 RepID=A0ABU0PJA9_9MICC|nr:hypothetical protein [Pseudarthrobacter siccitolerans]